MSTSLSHPENPRGALLANYYGGVLSGKHTLQTAQNGDLFIEAVCSQADPPTCVYEIISSQNGLPSVQASMRFSISPIFLDGRATELLRLPPSSSFEDHLRRRPPASGYPAYREAADLLKCVCEGIQRWQLARGRYSVVCLAPCGAPLASHREILGVS